MATVTNLGVEAVGLSLVDERGLITLVDTSHPAQTLVFLGGKETAIATARAILAALGEPVEGKPDRSELDAESKSRWVAIQGNNKVLDNWHTEVPLEQVISSAAGYTNTSFKVYELVAYVGPEPQPKPQRKVVRVQ